jgi:hypothetical protein
MIDFELHLYDTFFDELKLKKWRQNSPAGIIYWQLSWSHLKGRVINIYLIEVEFGLNGYALAMQNLNQHLV